VLRLRHPLSDTGGDDIGRNHPESSPGHEQDAAIDRRVVEGSQSLECRDLAGEIGVVEPAAEAGRGEGRRRDLEGSSAVEHRVVGSEGVVESSFVAETETDRVEAEEIGVVTDRLETPAGHGMVDPSSCRGS
jgi:hypothetical protein